MYWTNARLVDVIRCDSTQLVLESQTGGLKGLNGPVCHCAMSWRRRTLPDEGLAGVQQDVAALHYHPLYGQILPDVLRVTHFIVHHSGEHISRRRLPSAGSIATCAEVNQIHTWTAPLIWIWQTQDSCAPRVREECVPTTHVR